MTEHQPYEVVQEYPGFELRRYPEHVLAQTRVRGSFEGVGNKAFMRLVGYIGGRNAQSHKLAMTAPVLQESDHDSDDYVVSFVMPGGVTLPDAPHPNDPDVRLCTVPAQTAAALKFSGRWSRGRYEEHADRLLAAVRAADLQIDGPVRFARFAPPWTPWVVRHHDVVVPVVPPAAS